MRSHALALALALAALACRGRGDAAAADSSVAAAPAAPIAPAPQGSFAAVATHELEALRQPVTLGEWMRVHTADFHAESAEEIGNRCAISIAALRLDDGGLALRRAIFYVPMPDSTRPPPPDSVPEVEACVLGAITVSLPALVGDEHAAQEAVNEMRRVFGDTGQSWDAIGWFQNRVAEWKAGGLALTAGRQVHYGGHEVNGAAVTEDTVRVVAALPIAQATDALTMGELATYAPYAHPLIRHAIEVDRECNYAFDSIVTDAQAALQERNDDRVAAALHFLAGDALYEMARQAQGGEHALAAARHYREGLALDRDRSFADRRRILWNLWRVEAGLQPEGSIWQTECGDG